MTRKLLITAGIAAFALIPLTGIGTAEAHGGGFGGGGFHGGGFRGGFHDRDFFGRRDFRDGGIRFGGVYGGYFPGHYEYGRCYLTIYGTTYCY